MSNISTLALILLFYAVITYVIFPGLGYWIWKKKCGITYGIIAGSIVSLFLWFQYGKRMITL